MKLPDQPSVVDWAVPSTVSALEAVEPRLRLSTVVSTVYPSVAVIPAPRQTTWSSRQNQDFLAASVEPRPRVSWPSALYVPSVAPPAQTAPVGGAAGGSLTVRQRDAGDGGAGQAVGVDGRPIGVGVLAVAVGAAPPVGHAGAGVPAAQVLAVDALVERRSRGAHGDGEGPGGAAVGGPVHAAEDPGGDRFGGRGDRGVVEDGLAEGQHGQGLVEVLQERGPVVALQPALGHRLPGGGLVGRGGVRQHQDAADDEMAAYVVVLLDAQRVVHGLDAAADRPPGHAVHHQPVEQERGEGVGDGVEDELPVVVGHLPGGSRQEREQPGQSADQDGAVGPGVGHVGVLDERSVGVESVAAADQREHGGETGDTRGDLRRALGEDAAQDEHAAQVDTVGSGAHPAVGGDRGVRHEGVDRREVVGELGAAELVVDQAADVEREPRGADLPVPPVVVGGGRRRVRGRVHPVEAGQHGGEQVGVACQPSAVEGPCLGHPLQAYVAGGDVGADRADRQVVPERGGQRVHVGQEAGRGAAGEGEQGGERFLRGVVAGAQQGFVDPAHAKGVVCVGGEGGP